ncbi:MAG: hypothetical protein ABI947_24295 [Chloroflexota bacterium]
MKLHHLLVFIAAFIVQLGTPIYPVQAATTTFTGTFTASTQQFIYQLTTTAGSTVVFTLTDFPECRRDTFIVLRNSAGTEIATNDDNPFITPCGRVDSYLSYLFPSGGDFTIVATTYESRSGLPLKSPDDIGPFSLTFNGTFTGARFVGSSSIATLRDQFNDGRLNNDIGAEADQTVAVYCVDGGVMAYAIYKSQGYFAFKLTKDQIAKVPTKPKQNTLIHQALGVRLYRLTSGELQVNRTMLDPTQGDYVFRWAGCEEDVRPGGGKQK